LYPPWINGSTLTGEADYGSVAKDVCFDAANGSVANDV